MRFLAALLALAISLAGCSGSGDDDKGPTAEECEAMGLILGEKEVMDGMDAMGDGTMDHEGDHRHEAACVPAGPPATVAIAGLPSSTPVYSAVTFTWVLEHPGEGEAHTMNTQVRVSDASVPDADLGMPDTFGEELVKFEHQNFLTGKAFEAEWMPAEMGTYYLRAFALVNQENLWSEEFIVEVTQVEPTGTVYTVTVAGGGLPEQIPDFGIDEDDTPLSIVLGDAVTWESGDGLDTYEIVWTSQPDGVDLADTSSGAQAIVFTVPGTYDYDALGTLHQIPVLPEYQGRISVSAP